MAEKPLVPLQKRKSTTSEDEVKSEKLEKPSKCLGKTKKELQKEYQSRASQSDDPADLQNSQDVMDYVDSCFEKHQFHPLKEYKDLTFKKTGTLNLPFKVIEFFKQCLSKDGDLSAQVYLKAEQKCSKMEIGTWSKHHNNTCQPQTYGRVMKFKVKVPFAIPIPLFPKYVDVIHEQRFRFFGPECLLIDDTLRAPDVPFGDTCYVVQTWKVSDIGDSGECQASIQHACRWVKTSFFQKMMLEPLIKKGICRWFSDWTKWLKRNLDERQVKKRPRESESGNTNRQKKRKLH